MISIALPISLKVVFRINYSQDTNLQELKIQVFRAFCQILAIGFLLVEEALWCHANLFLKMLRHMALTRKANGQRHVRNAEPFLN